MPLSYRRPDILSEAEVTHCGPLRVGALLFFQHHEATYRCRCRTVWILKMWSYCFAICYPLMTNTLTRLVEEPLRFGAVVEEAP